MFQLLDMNTKGADPHHEESGHVVIGRKSKQKGGQGEYLRSSFPKKGNKKKKKKLIAFTNQFRVIRFYFDGSDFFEHISNDQKQTQRTSVIL